MWKKIVCHFENFPMLGKLCRNHRENIMLTKQENNDVIDATNRKRKRNAEKNFDIGRDNSDTEWEKAIHHKTKKSQDVMARKSLMS